MSYTSKNPVFSSATISGDLLVDTTTFKVDSTNNRVGVGTASPQSGSILDVVSSSSPRLFVRDTSTGNPGFEAWSNGNQKVILIWNESNTSVELYNGNISTGAARLLLPSNGGVTLKGTTTNDNAAASFIGEYVESTSSSVGVAASNTFGDSGVSAISLTAGDWDISAVAWFDRAGATFTSVQIIMGIGTTTGNSGAGLTNGVNKVIYDPNVATWNFVSLVVPTFRVSISSTTSYYLKSLVAAFSSGTPTVSGRLSARRVR